MNFKYPSRIRKAAPLEIKCNLFLLRGQSHQLVFLRLKLGNELFCAILFIFQSSLNFIATEKFNLNNILRLLLMKISHFPTTASRMRKNAKGGRNCTLSEHSVVNPFSDWLTKVNIHIDHSKKGLPKESSNNVYFRSPFRHYSNTWRVDGEWGDILIHCKRSIRSLLNFSSAKRLKDEKDRKNIPLPNFSRKVKSIWLTSKKNKWSPIWTIAII